jgi:hypothetical protein
MKRPALLGLGALLIVGIPYCGPIGAQEADEAESSRADSAQERAFELELSGDHEMTWRLPVYEWDYDGDAREAKFANLFRVQATEGDIKLVSEGSADLRAEDSGSRAGHELKAGENAIYWSLRSFRLGIGWQYFSWGTADKQNPTDNLNARDYSAQLEAEKIPALALSATWYPSDIVSVQLVAKPKAEASIFPADFVAETQSGVDAFTGRLNGVLHSSVSSNVEAEGPPNRPDSLVIGGRIAFVTAAADFSACYLYDWDAYYTPAIGLADVAGFYYPESVELVKKRAHRFGLDAKTTVHSLGLWAEGAFSLLEGYSEDSYAVRPPSLGWTIGADLSFGPGSAYYVNLQYLGQYVLNYDRSFYGDYSNGSPKAEKMGDRDYMQRYFERAMAQKLGGQSEGLLQGCTLNLKFPLRESTVTPTLKVIYLKPFLYDDSVATRYGSLGLMPEIDIEPVDSFHIKIGAELCYAWIRPRGGSVELDTDSDRIGVHTPDNNFYLAVEYAWNVRKTK